MPLCGLNNIYWLFTAIPVCCSPPSCQALQFILLQLPTSHPSPDARRADQISQLLLFKAVLGFFVVSTGGVSVFFGFSSGYWDSETVFLR